MGSFQPPLTLARSWLQNELHFFNYFLQKIQSEYLVHYTTRNKRMLPMEFSFLKSYFNKILIKNRIKKNFHIFSFINDVLIFIRKSSTFLGSVCSLLNVIHQSFANAHSGTWTKLLLLAKVVLSIFVYIISLDLIFRYKGVKGYFVH